MWGYAVACRGKAAIASGCGPNRRGLMNTILRIPNPVVQRRKLYLRPTYLDRQPLDVGCFAALKKAYGRQAEDLMRTEGRILVG